MQLCTLDKNVSVTSIMNIHSSYTISLYTRCIFNGSVVTRRLFQNYIISDKVKFS